MPVEVAVEIGRTRMTIGEALALGLGSVVTVGRLAGDPVDLLVNGRVIARGEVVAIEEELGLRITEIAAPVVERGHPKVMTGSPQNQGKMKGPLSPAKEAGLQAD